MPHAIPARPLVRPIPLIAAVLIVLVAVVARAAGPFDLTPTLPEDRVSRLTVGLEFGGELLAKNYAPGPALPDPQAKPTEPTKLPLSVKATLEFDERVLSPERSVRLYRKADATIRSEGGARVPRLASDRRLIVVERRGDERPALASPAGLLTREELDLIDVAAGGATLDALLPGKRLDEGDAWSIAARPMGDLLGLDSVAVCEVQGVVDAGNRSFCRFQIAGSVQGAVDSAATEFEVRGIGLMDLDRGCVTKLNLAVDEKRGVGDARPGVDGTAKISIKRLPIATPRALTEAGLGKAGGGDLERLSGDQDLVFAAARQGFRLRHDRRWFVAAETSDTLMLRRVDASGLVAQTTLKRLPPKAEERRPTLESFEQEVRYSLGDSFGSLVSSEQWTNPSGCYCMALVVRGKAEGVPVEWRHQLVMPGEDASADTRHMVSLATTIERSLADHADNADRDLANALELVEPTKGTPAVSYRQKRRR